MSDLVLPEKKANALLNMLFQTFVKTTKTFSIPKNEIAPSECQLTNQSDCNSLRRTLRRICGPNPNVLLSAAIKVRDAIIMKY